MVKRSLSILLLLLVLSAYADNNQPQLQFEYDAAGNRISRHFVQPIRQVPTVPQTVFSVYPTVVTDVITITTLNEIKPEEFHYTVTDVSGNTVLKGDIVSQSTQVQMPLQKGYYILYIYSVSEQHPFNLLKNQ